MNNNELLQQAEQVFVDHKQFTKFMLAGSYRLLCDVMKQDNFPTNSATITGLDCVVMSIDEHDILYNHYFQGMTFEHIASNVLQNASAPQVRLIHKRLLKKLRMQARKFFFLEREAFIARYINFIHSVEANCPASDDLSIREIGLIPRTANALYHGGITTASQMYFATKERLLKVRGFGPLALEEVLELKYNLLADNIP